MSEPVPQNRIQIKERRESVLILLTKGMKGYEIAKKLDVDASTISRDVHYLIGQSQNYLSSLAKDTLPFMYQTSIEGIKNVLKECWSIYTLDSNNTDKDITWFHKIAALKLAKECNLRVSTKETSSSSTCTWLFKRLSFWSNSFCIF